MVPEGWDILPLGEMADFRNGLNFTKGDDGEPIKIVTIPDFWQRTEIRDMSGIKSITPKKKVPASSLLQSGDMLFVRSNGNPELVGRCLFFPDVDEPISFSGFTIRGRVDKEHLVPEFAAYVMLTDRTKAQFRRGRGGGNISNLSQDILAGVQVALPPLPEQRKIADILSTWDEAIEKTEALLTNARTQKRALMQQLLTGKRRFPTYQGQPWREVRLGEVGIVSSAGVDKKSEAGQPDVRLLNFLDVFRREFIFDEDLDHVVSAPPAKVEKCNVQCGDIFFTPSSETRNDIAISAVAAEDMPGVCYSYHVVRFRLTEPWDLNFRAYVFQTDDFRKQAYKLGDGGGQRYVISQGNFRNMVVRVPSIAEQKQIGRILRAASEEVTDLEKQIAKLRTEKKALMQQLLTGKRRVVV